MMNIFCLANTLQCILYKFMSERGVDLLEYTLFRNLTIMALSLALLYLQRRDPVKEGFAMTEEIRKRLFVRAVLGLVITLIINACLTMIPFSLLVILFQTSPFWTSIMGYYYNGEPLYAMEIVGMVLCFIAVLYITQDESSD